MYYRKKSFCQLTENDPRIDYKNPEFLANFISEAGQILPRRTTNVSAKNQRKLAKAIKLSRFLALMLYTDRQVL